VSIGDSLKSLKGLDANNQHHNYNSDQTLNVSHSHSNEFICDLMELLVDVSERGIDFKRLNGIRQKYMNNPLFCTLLEKFMSVIHNDADNQNNVNSRMNQNLNSSTFEKSNRFNENNTSNSVSDKDQQILE